MKAWRAIRIITNGLGPERGKNKEGGGEKADTPERASLLDQKYVAGRAVQKPL